MKLDNEKMKYTDHIETREEFQCMNPPKYVGSSIWVDGKFHSAWKPEEICIMHERARQMAFDEIFGEK